jgi:hypothetical protein
MLDVVFDVSVTALGTDPIVARIVTTGNKVLKLILKICLNIAKRSLSFNRKVRNIVGHPH